MRITSNDSFTVGSLWVTDMYHVPYGVSLLLGLITPLDHDLIMIIQLVFRLAGLVEVGVLFCFLK